MANSTEKPTVADYCLGRLADLGIKHAFGLPGDFAFPIDDAIADESRLTWVVCSNELNASYAANAIAVAFPIPEAAPVISATLPLNGYSIYLILSV